MSMSTSYIFLFFPFLCRASLMMAFLSILGVMKRWCCDKAEKRRVHHHPFPLDMERKWTHDTYCEKQYPMSMEKDFSGEWNLSRKFLGSFRPRKGPQNDVNATQKGHEWKNYQKNSSFSLLYPLRRHQFILDRVRKLIHWKMNGNFWKGLFDDRLFLLFPILNPVGTKLPHWHCCYATEVIT